MSAAEHIPILRGLERKRRIIGAYRSLFNSPLGRTVLADMSRRAQMHTHGMADTERETCFIAGKRDMVVYIHRTLRLTPQQIDALVYDKEPTDE